MIRPATSGDLQAVREIVRAAYVHYVPRIGREPGPMGDDYAARIAARETFVTGEPVKGVIVLIDEADHLLLDNIAVDPAAHGTGVGRKLLQFADQEAVRRGYNELRLYTHEKMTENVALYARAGWEETHRAEQNGFPRVFFRKTV